MHKYRAKQLLVLPAGSIVGLNDKQAADRVRRIDDLGGGRFRLAENLQFKAGESFGYEGEMSKVLIDQAEALDAAPAKETAAAEPAGKKSGSKAGWLFTR